MVEKFNGSSFLMNPNSMGRFSSVSYRKGLRVRCVNPFYRLIIVAQGNKNLVKTNDYLSNFEQQQKDKQITESKVG